jgi:hypothetical protein
MKMRASRASGISRLRAFTREATQSPITMTSSRN